NSRPVNPPFNMKPPLDGAAFQFVTTIEMSDFDIIIVGGGIAGASLGAEVAGKRRTLIIEAEAQCGYHSTGRSAAFYLESYGGPEVARLNAASRGFLATPPREFSERGFLHNRGNRHLTRGT